MAARLLRKGYTDVAVIEPSNAHYYHPLWTLVGGGQAKSVDDPTARSLRDAQGRDVDQKRRQRI